ncbi:DUF6049 family protein [Nocardioides sp. R-C-SC26]|uniref:DUF6049 family protein n=1 Tax=Nocardioides sp. R-C-SC26 TaxID=2870414 RepID=UPI001E5A6CEB|nr:DUF6049 family protein [Nocardioides sp. R-C-SC26]
MVSPPSILRDLSLGPPIVGVASGTRRGGRADRIAAIVLLAPLIATLLLLAPATQAPASAAPAAPNDDAPLRVVIDAMAPAYVPERGNVIVAGTVTNRSEETWTTINLYAVWGGSLGPLRSPGELAAAAASPSDAPFGDRIVYEGKPGKIDSLEPGASATFTVTVPASALPTDGGGAYLFGIHASGQSDSTPRDLVTDGRARTFLPYLPSRVTTPVDVAIVLPLTRAITYAGDGSVDGTGEWQRTLSSGGRLADLLDFAGSAGGRPVSWLVDPALIDAVDRLRQGNPGRSLAPTVTEPTPGDGETGTAAPLAETDPDAEADPVIATAQSWMAEATDRLGSAADVLALPYGNLDVPATLAHAPALLAEARTLGADALGEAGIETTPALASPGGYLDAASITTAGDDTTVLATDLMFPGYAPAVAAVDGVDVVVTSSGASAGSPGPRPTQSAVGLRQRILAEAAVRALRSTQPPLTVLLPTEWGLSSASAFWSGLDAPWLNLVGVSDIAANTASTSVDPAALTYPELQSRRELDPEFFERIAALVTEGGTLQRVLVGNETLADVVTRQALTGAAYSVRNSPSAGRLALARMQGWFSDVFDSLQLRATEGVTLSSQSGTFLVTVANDLDQTVRVGIRAEADGGITVRAADPVQIGPRSRANVLVTATTRTNKVHNVELFLTDEDGVRLGSADQVPIRSVQVSDVIWVIMGTGIGVLFIAIAIRLARRIRAARRGAPAETA